MALFTRCIIGTPYPEDGLRISVMSRHTLSDGFTIDPRIIDFHFHDSGLGPLPSLIGSYYKRGLKWERFEGIYLMQLQLPKIADRVQSLAQVALYQDVTLLCIECTPEHCHRRLLAEECQKYCPELRVEHR